MRRLAGSNRTTSSWWRSWAAPLKKAASGNAFLWKNKKMPYTLAQHKLFEAAGHNPQIAQNHGMTQAKALKMAGEGVKQKPSPQQYAKALQLK